ncbi:STAS domain-containing protein [Mycolicibacterium thermoresistibile]
MSATGALTTSVEHRDDSAVLRVQGVVDLATGDALQQAIDDLIATRPSALVVDLSAVDFLASVGLQILVATHERLSPSARFAVVADGPATSRPIQLTRLDEVIALYPTLDEALSGERAE